MTFLFVPFAALKQTTLRVCPALRVFVDGLSCTVPSRRRMSRRHYFFVGVPTFSRALKPPSLPNSWPLCMQYVSVVLLEGSEPYYLLVGSCCFSVFLDLRLDLSKFFATQLYALLFGLTRRAVQLAGKMPRCISF
jgi:hypothetical protein